jgi:hypothetical protein
LGRTICHRQQVVCLPYNVTNRKIVYLYQQFMD